MRSVARRVRGLVDRRLPIRTRVGLLVLDVRRRVASRALYGVPYGPGRVYLSEDDFVVDLASFDFAAREGSYATDYQDALAVDLGAHKGYFGAYAVTHGACMVIAYEPQRTNVAVLEQTAAAYRRRDVGWFVHEAAVDAAAGRAELHVMGASWGHALAPPAAFAEHEVGVETVAVVALADVLAAAVELAAGARVVVKVNIEGSECSAILGTDPGAWSEVDELLVETHPWAACDAAALEAHLLPTGLSRAASSHPAVLRMRREAPSRSGRRTDSR